MGLSSLCVIFFYSILDKIVILESITATLFSVCFIYTVMQHSEIYNGVKWFPAMIQHGSKKYIKKNHRQNWNIS